MTKPNKGFRKPIRFSVSFFNKKKLDVVSVFVYRSVKDNKFISIKTRETYGEEGIFSEQIPVRTLLKEINSLLGDEDFSLVEEPFNKKEYDLIVEFVKEKLLEEMNKDETRN